MVNYLYALNEIEKNHEAFAEKGVVAASSMGQSLAGRSALPRSGAHLMTARIHNLSSGSIPDLHSGAYAMNANLFDRLERSIADLTKTAIISPAGEMISYAASST
jgi:hypothetical protein